MQRQRLDEMFLNRGTTAFGGDQNSVQLRQTTAILVLIFFARQIGEPQPFQKAWGMVDSVSNLTVDSRGRPRGTYLLEDVRVADNQTRNSVKILKGEEGLSIMARLSWRSYAIRYEISGSDQNRQR